MARTHSPPDSDSDDPVIVGPDDLRDFNAEGILPVDSEDLQKIREWLKPTPYDLVNGEYRRHLATHLEGTGDWLVSTHAYRHWHDSADSGILWIKGIPGSGKSVVAASLIDQLSREGCPVLFFFFRQIIDANHQPRAVLQDWLHQVLEYSPPLQRSLKEYVDSRRSVDSLSMNELWRDLKSALISLPRAFCVTDALDEMDRDNDEFLQALVELGRWRPAAVKVLITSRPVATVERPLQSLQIPQLRLEERLVDIDIAAYVQFRLEGSTIPTQHHATVKAAVPGRANGLFLYAKLAMDAFVEPGADVNRVLEELPVDLNVMYTDLLREHARRSNVPDELQLLILQWVTHATRPLRLLEIAEMVDVTQPQALRDLKAAKDLVRSACGPLLEVLPDETISVVHHSLTEFLKGSTRSNLPHPGSRLDYPILEPGSTNLSLAGACLRYLESGCLDDWKVKDHAGDSDFFYAKTKKQDQLGLRLEHPFLEYAAANWHVHARRSVAAGADPHSINEALVRFFSNQQRFTTWLDIDWPAKNIADVTPLHASARTGLVSYTQFLLSQPGAAIECKDASGYTPLFWAAMAGHADVVQVLVDHGARPDEEDSTGLKPLHKAASGNFPGVVTVLCSAGVDPLTPKTKEDGGRRCGNAPRSRGHTPLMYAVQNGHLEAVEAFLPFLKDIETVHRALTWASSASHGKVVEMLLQHPGVDVNTKIRSATALFYACNSTSLDKRTVEALLRAGADPNILCKDLGDEFGGMGSQRMVPWDTPSDRGYTALHALCGLRPGRGSGRWSLEFGRVCLELLLNAGADIHQRDPDGKTALHHACKSRCDLIPQLIQAGADANSLSDDGLAPLHTDGGSDGQSTLLLIQNGADINLPRELDGMTPLLLRLSSRHAESSLSFLAYKPDLTATDHDGNGPLHIALMRMHYKTNVDIVKALLHAGANPNVKNKKGQTPLHVISDNFDIFPTMVEAGADLEARDNEGRTVLFQRVSHSKQNTPSSDILQPLLDLGSVLDTRDFRGRTLLHESISHMGGHLDFLISLGLDPTATDYDGNTLFHEAAQLVLRRHHDSYTIFERLAKLGVNPDMSNNRGRTPLHVLSSQKLDPSFLDHLLKWTTEADPLDIDSIRPIHLACTISDQMVLTLIHAGGDPFATTAEGMTTLHLASRSRQPNIVGLLLSKATKRGEEFRREFVNKKTVDSITALWYACASGRPETVRLLLDAGADASLPSVTPRSGHKYRKSYPLDACTRFELEQALWFEPGRQFKWGSSELVAGGLFSRDDTRPHFDVRKKLEELHPLNSDQFPGQVVFGEHDSTRLEEIVDMLAARDVEMTVPERYGASRLDLAINGLELGNSDYTFNCLVQLRNRINPVSRMMDKRFHPLARQYKMDVVPKALEDSADLSLPSSIYSPRKNLFKELLGMRRYDLVEKLMTTDGESLQPSPQYGCRIHDLVSYGFADLLRRVCTTAEVKKFEDSAWCERFLDEWDTHEAYATISPLVLTACERELPNMDVVKLLVEELGASPSAQHTKSMNSALHQLAAGRHWWYVAQAMPYLISKGACLDSRDCFGKTPLHCALQPPYDGGIFSKEAAKVLIDSGADVNAADDEGVSCLAKACGGNGDPALIKLLIAHGAIVTAPALFAAINSRRVEILDALLSFGADPNLRLGEEHKLKRGPGAWAGVDDSEYYPLLYAARRAGYGMAKVDDRDQAIAYKMTQKLLDSGANPYATFSRSEPRSGITEKTNHVIIHTILAADQIFEPFLAIPSLDIERRDFRGRTLLLASAANGPDVVCTSTTAADRGHTTIFQALLDLGADITARDNDGRNVLHLMTQGTWNDPMESLTTAITLAPQLIHQLDNDGNMPFYYAVRRGAPKTVALLLDRGADPLRSDANGDTALHHSVGRLARQGQSRAEAQLGIIHRLLTFGIPVNGRNNKGETPVFAFYRQGLAVHSTLEIDPGTKEAFLKALEHYGVDYQVRNEHGQNLLHIVAGLTIDSRFGSLGVMSEELVGRFKELMDKGLDPMAEDAQQRTSLDIAAACGNTAILKLFERKGL